MVWRGDSHGGPHKVTVGLVGSHAWLGMQDDQVSLLKYSDAEFMSCRGATGVSLPHTVVTKIRTLLATHKCFTEASVPPPWPAGRHQRHARSSGCASGSPHRQRHSGPHRASPQHQSHRSRFASTPSACMTRPRLWAESVGTADRELMSCLNRVSKANYGKMSTRLTS